MCVCIYSKYMPMLSRKGSYICFKVILSRVDLYLQPSTSPNTKHLPMQCLIIGS